MERLFQLVICIFFMPFIVSCASLGDCVTRPIERLGEGKIFSSVFTTATMPICFLGAVTGNESNAERRATVAERSAQINANAKDYSNHANVGIPLAGSVTSLVCEWKSHTGQAVYKPDDNRRRTQVTHVDEGCHGRDPSPPTIDIEDRKRRILPHDYVRWMLIKKVKFDCKLDEWLKSTDTSKLYARSDSRDPSNILGNKVVYKSLFENRYRRLEISISRNPRAGWREAVANGSNSSPDNQDFPDYEYTLIGRCKGENLD